VDPVCKIAAPYRKRLTPLGVFGHYTSLAVSVSRLVEQLFLEDAITQQFYNELEQGYMYMMQLRIVRQIQKIIDEKGQADNYINPKKLSRLDQTMLKEIFKRLETSQAKLGFDFLGA